MSTEIPTLAELGMYNESQRDAVPVRMGGGESSGLARLQEYMRYRQGVAGAVMFSQKSTSFDDPNGKIADWEWKSGAGDMFSDNAMTDLSGSSYPHQLSLSPYLTHGCLSVRMVYKEICERILDPKQRETLLRRLYMRDYMHFLSYCVENFGFQVRCLEFR